jgi:hypothetical protein
MQSSWPASHLARADVADFLLETATRDSWTGRIAVLTAQVTNRARRDSPFTEMQMSSAVPQTSCP